MKYAQVLLLKAVLLAGQMPMGHAAEPLAVRPAHLPRDKPPQVVFDTPGKPTANEKARIKDYEMQQQIKLLLSRKQAEQQLANAWFEREHDTLIAQFDLVDPSFQEQILRSLNYWISPWERSRARAGYLWIPERPIARPVADPRAAKFRAFLLTIVANADKLPVETAAKELTWEQGMQWRVLETACECLGEVGDAATAKQIRDALAQEQKPRVGRWYMNCLERIYGLPEQSRYVFFCGLGLETFEARQRQDEVDRVEYYEPAKKKFLAWLDKHANLDETARCRAAIAAWDQILLGKNFAHQLSSYDHHPIYRFMRLGDPLVPLLRERQNLMDSVLVQGEAEFYIAAITGNVDDRLIRFLLRAEHVMKKLNPTGNESSNAEKARNWEYHLLALQIIQAGHAKGYLPELTAMLQDDRYSQSEVAKTLAMVHGTEALPILRKEPKENFTAWHTIAVLEKREE